MQGSESGGLFRCLVKGVGGGAFEDRPGLDPQKGGQAACSLLEPGLDKGTFITLQAALSYCGTPPFHGTQGSGLHPVIAIKF